MPSKTPDRFLSFAEVAQILGLTVESVKKGKAETNTIPRIKLGRRTLFSFNTLQSWMAAKAREAEEDQRREKLSVIDLMAERARRKQYVKDMAKQISDQERRRSSNYE